MKRFLINRFLLVFIVLSFGTICFSYSKKIILAGVDQDKVTELEKQIKEIEQKLEASKNQTVTLTNTIRNMENQINLTTIKIEQTKEKLNILAKEINDLINKIDQLEVKLDDLGKLLLARIDETYKQGRTQTWQLLFSSKNISEFLSRMRYLEVVQARDKKMMTEVKKNQETYKDQKKILDEKKKEEEELQLILERQKTTLAQQKKGEEDLLEITKNDEKNFQAILTNLKQQKQTLLSAVTASGETLECKVWSSDDNYYNQADCRWATNLIGGFNDQNDPSYMWKYGCAVTSAAMVLSKLGFSIDSGNLSQSPIYNNDLISWQKVPEIYPVNLIGSPYGGVNWETIDQQLNNGNWVIVHVTTGSYYGHYIVLKGKEGDDYKIHDPYYGPNLSLSRYGKGVVDQMVIYQKN